MSKRYHRGWRRHHRARLRKRAYQLYRRMRFITDLDCWRLALRNADQLKACSCWMCCNPRRKMKLLPIAELRRCNRDGVELGLVEDW